MNERCGFCALEEEEGKEGAHKNRRQGAHFRRQANIGSKSKIQQ